MAFSQMTTDDEIPYLDNTVEAQGEFGVGDRVLCYVRDYSLEGDGYNHGQNVWIHGVVTKPYENQDNMVYVDVPIEEDTPKLLFKHDKMCNGVMICLDFGEKLWPDCV